MMIRKIIVISLIWLLGGCSLNAGPASPARTYYESLLLGSPTQAVETFISAYQKSDFHTVYLVLAPRAQRTWHENFTLLNWPLLIRVASQNDPQIRMVLEETDIAGGAFEHSGETSYEFDEIMLAAQNHQLLWLDLSGETHINDTQPARDAVGQPATDVFVSLSQYPEDLVFRTVQAPSGKWRVYQVILPGGNEDYVPWGVPALEE